MNALVAAGLAVRVRGRQHAVEPLMALGHAAHEIKPTGRRPRNCSTGRQNGRGGPPARTARARS
eukprot:187287-Lingulodinium_polyedra.AAC.1